MRPGDAGQPSRTARPRARTSCRAALDAPPRQPRPPRPTAGPGRPCSCGSISCTARARASAAMTWPSVAPQIAGSSVQSNCLPRTAAATMTSATCGSRAASLFRTDPTIESGMPVLMPSRTRQPSGRRSSSPEATAAARISSTAKGSPTQRASSLLASAAARGSASRQAPAISSTWRWLSRGTATSSAERLARIDVAMSSAADGSLSRSVATSRICRPARLSAR